MLGKDRKSWTSDGIEDSHGDSFTVFLTFFVKLVYFRKGFYLNNRELFLVRETATKKRMLHLFPEDFSSFSKALWARVFSSLSLLLAKRGSSDLPCGVFSFA